MNQLLLSFLFVFSSVWKKNRKEERSQKKEIKIKDFFFNFHRDFFSFFLPFFYLLFLSFFARKNEGHVYGLCADPTFRLFLFGNVSEPQLSPETSTESQLHNYRRVQFVHFYSYLRILLVA